MTRHNNLHKRLGSRGSKLALRQSQLVAEALGKIYPHLQIEIQPITTMGDKIQDRTLIELGGKGLFVKEIEEALLNKDIDFAVHSCKDMPTELPDGLIIAAILPREDPRDALIAPKYDSLASIPLGATVGTASLRRQAQLKMLRPDLIIQPLRGNVDTRLRKIDEGQAEATILALAGLKRLGLEEHAKTVLPIDKMLPAVAQGAICIECRADDDETLNIIDKLDHLPSRLAIIAERACLRILEGSCRTPIAAYATCEKDSIHLQALIAKPDGSLFFRAEGQAPQSDAMRLGEKIGSELRAKGGTGFFKIA